MNNKTILSRGLKFGLKFVLKLNDKYCCDGEGKYELPTSLVMDKNK